MANTKIRLFVDHALGQGQTVPLSADQAHYLFGVMRRGTGDVLSVFNGKDGEWRAEIAEAGKRKGSLLVLEQDRVQTPLPDIWLLFAPLKKARTDFLVEKAVELGAAKIVPVLTDYTNSERVRPDRLQAHAVEAAEQSNGLNVPRIADPIKLERLLADWPEDRQLIFCDEAAAGTPAGEFKPHDGPAAILIGPEGGFSPAERSRLHGLTFGSTISLGPRILRAETAAVAALSLWMAARGDWG